MVFRRLIVWAFCAFGGLRVEAFHGVFWKGGGVGVWGLGFGVLEPGSWFATAAPCLGGILLSRASELSPKEVGV